ncbi:MAG: AraC family transcriptional regulator [Acidimicrobiales bacterium]
MTPGRLTRLNTLNTDRTTEAPKPRLKPRGLPPALEAHGIYTANNPVEAALYGNDLLGPHEIHVDDSDLADFQSTFHGVLIRDVTLGYLDYSTAVMVKVEILATNHLIIVPAAGNSTITTAGVTVETSPVLAAVPTPGKRMTLECKADAAHLVVRIERRTLETHLSRLIGRTVDRAIEFKPSFDLSTGAANRWNFAVQMLHAELYEPESLLHRAAGLSSVEEFLMSALLFCQPSNFTDQLSANAKPISVAVQTAVDYIEGHLATPLAVQDVARAAGVGLRTLQNQFGSDLDQTPTQFIRNRRLERARSDLADASSSNRITVTDIATRWGFTHLGRFAVVYRSRFGESPSQTLRN